MRQRGRFIIGGVILVMILVVGGSAWWWQSRVPMWLSELPGTALAPSGGAAGGAGGGGSSNLANLPGLRTFQVSVDAGSTAIASARVVLRFPPGALQINDQDNFARGIQIIPITDFNSAQEMTVDPAAGLLTLRLYNQGGLKQKGKINVLTFQAKPLKSFTLQLDCAASILYTDYERGETLKARCQGLKVSA